MSTTRTVKQVPSAWTSGHGSAILRATVTYLKHGQAEEVVLKQRTGYHHLPVNCFMASEGGAAAVACPIAPRAITRGATEREGREAVAERQRGLLSAALPRILPTKPPAANGTAEVAIWARRGPATRSMPCFCAKSQLTLWIKRGDD